METRSACLKNTLKNMGIWSRGYTNLCTARLEFLSKRFIGASATLPSVMWTPKRFSFGFPFKTNRATQTRKRILGRPEAESIRFGSGGTRFPVPHFPLTHLRTKDPKPNPNWGNFKVQRLKSLKSKKQQLVHHDVYRRCCTPLPWKSSLVEPSVGAVLGKRHGHFFWDRKTRKIHQMGK